MHDIINDLITSSGQTVERGVALVGEAGRALEGIAASVSGISKHVTSIVSSSSEQSVSLSEVNAAVGQLDEATQKNAAMFEETTAASHALMRQAETLNTRVSQFTIRAARAKPAAPPDRASHAAKEPETPARPVHRRASTGLAAANERDQGETKDVWEDF